jgi:MFS family permease
MIVGGSTYAFTLVLATFLLGIGIGSALVARGARAPADTAALAAVAQGITAAGAALLLVGFGLLPLYIIKVLQIPDLYATGRLVLLGLAIGLVVLVPAIGMGMTFPLLTDLAARRDAARAADVGRAYALNTAGSIAGAALTGFVLVVVFGSDRTLRAGVLVSVIAALALAARGVAEGSPQHRRLRGRVLGAAVLASAALAAVLAAPRWDTRLIDLGPPPSTGEQSATPWRWRPFSPTVARASSPSARVAMPPSASGRPRSDARSKSTARRTPPITATWTRRSCSGSHPWRRAPTPPRPSSSDTAAA